jgi:anaerobic selenocysteine-containing dehydrogenase
LTGRGTSAQWHAQTRTRCSAVLRQLYPKSIYLEIHPDDAARLEIGVNDPVKISSRRASVLATACLTPTDRPGQVFLPMHDETANRLTYPSFDSYSRQPSYKHCALKVVRA